MDTIADLRVEQIILLILTFVRISCIVAVAPIFGSQDVSLQLKAGLAFMLTLIMFPLISGQIVEIPVKMIPFIIMVIKEVSIGLIIGFSMTLLFAGIQFAGSTIGMQMGFGLVNVIDPLTQEEVTVVGQFQFIIAILIFLIISGHHFVIQAMLDSLNLVPLASVHYEAGSLTEYMIQLTAGIFIIALKMGAPILVSLLLTEVGLGVIAKTVPQMNILMVGIPVKIGLGTLVWIISLPLFYVVFEKAIQQMRIDIFNLMYFLKV